LNEDLPARREAPNVLARALIVMFGRGYALIGIAAILFVPWYFLRSSSAQFEVAYVSHISDLTWGPWARVAWGVASAFSTLLVRSIVIALVALGARQVASGHALDLRANLRVVGVRLLPFLGVVFFWLIALEGLDRIIFSRLELLWASAPAIAADVTGIVHSLVGLCTSWSLLGVTFGARGAVEAFLYGVLGPWRLGARSLFVALAFILAHFAQRSIAHAISVAFSHSALAPLFQSALTTAARGLVEALSVTLLTIILTVAFLDAETHGGSAPRARHAGAQT